MALKKLSESAAARGNLTLELSLPEHDTFLPPDVEQAVYRILQEALENVVHHANARKLTVVFSQDEGQVRLSVCDDGQGFNPRQQVTVGHYGLQGMRERAELVGGLVQVTSQPQNGTAVQLFIEGITL